MYINWFGQGCFKIQSDNSTLIIDPFGKDTGLKSPRLAADIAIYVSEKDTELVKGLNDKDPFIITNPGEYEIKGTFIYGLPCKNPQSGEIANVYRIECENMAIAHLGNLNFNLENGQLEKLEGIDILMIPIGGDNLLSARQASELISQLEPRIVIPMYYKIPGLKMNIDPLDKFCKEIGVYPTETIAKYRITKKDLPVDEMKVVVLEP